MTVRIFDTETGREITTEDIKPGQHVTVRFPFGITLNRLAFQPSPETHDMEQITITLNTGNAAFTEGPATEVARILRDLAGRIERDGDFPARLRDINGNTVGHLTVKRGA